jgi:hypothetical protein
MNGGLHDRAPRAPAKAEHSSLKVMMTLPFWVQLQRRMATMTGCPDIFFKLVLHCCIFVGGHTLKRIDGHNYSINDNGQTTERKPHNGSELLDCIRR